MIVPQWEVFIVCRALAKPWRREGAADFALPTTKRDDRINVGALFQRLDRDRDVEARIAYDTWQLSLDKFNPSRADTHQTRLVLPGAPNFDLDQSQRTNLSVGSVLGVTGWRLDRG
jgi:hypothetical protein